MIFLIVFYGFLGLIADIALIIYGVLLAGVVLAWPVTMTLPGIAGTILTIVSPLSEHRHLRAYQGGGARRKDDPNRDRHRLPARLQDDHRRQRGRR